MNPQRPELDWSPDAELPQRFRTWKRQISNEVLLQTAEDPSKKAAYACAYVIVCSGEHGEHILRESGHLGERKDYKVLLDQLEKSVSPRANFLEDSVNYFILKQGHNSVRDFQHQSETMIERIIPNYDASATMTHKDIKSLLLRNLLLVGLRHKDVLRDCQKMSSKDCTAEHILKLAYQAEIRDGVKERIARNLSSAQPSALQDLNACEQATASLNHIAEPSKGRPYSQNIVKCRWCGSSKLCKRKECPAYDRNCSYCHRKGHFSRVCRQKQRDSRHRDKKEVHNVDYDKRDDDDDDDDKCSVYSFNHLTDPLMPESEHIKPLWVTIPGGKQVHKVNTEIDTGAACNILPGYIHRSIFGDAPPEHSNARIRAYGNVPVKVIGRCFLDIHTADKSTTRARFEVTEHRGHPIIGRSTSKAIGYVEYPQVSDPALEDEPIELHVKNLSHLIKHPKITQRSSKSVTIEGIAHPLPLTKTYIEQQFQDIFDGLGELPGGEHHLKLKPNAVPVQHSPRQVPEKKKPAYKAELERLQREGIIMKEDGHTDWVNSIVAAIKPDGSVRLCLDPKDLNENLERNPYYMKTIDELSAELSGNSLFTVLDAKQGYWHVPLDDESSKMTTFNTPWGKFRFTRLPFGLKISGDVFQERLDAVLSSHSGVTNVVDDCIVKAPSIDEHDVTLLTLLHSARLNGIKFNSKKMQFKQNNVHFFGHNVTSSGLRSN